MKNLCNSDLKLSRATQFAQIKSYCFVTINNKGPRRNFVVVVVVVFAVAVAVAVLVLICGKS